MHDTRSGRSSPYVEAASKGMAMRWNAGSSVIMRSILDRRVGNIRALTVVVDRPELIALYLAPGYPCKRRSGPRGGPRGRVLLVDSGQHEDRLWTHNNVLILYRPGDAYTTQLFRRAEDGIFSGWYIDLQEPLRRTPLGFDTRDHVLDAVVAPDRLSWSWKDEDELAWRLAAGMVNVPAAAAIRAEGERAVERLMTTDPPLYQEWEMWSPEPSWRTPTIPANWKELF